MWRILLLNILVANAQSAFDTPLCPDGGEPVCAKSGLEFIYFENECKLNVFSYKELFAGRPSPTKVELVECFSNCAGIICPALFQPVCAQQVPGGALRTVSNACLVNQLICDTRQQWVIIANGACPETSSPEQGLFATLGIDAIPPLAPATTPALAPVPAPSYEPKATYEPTAVPPATYYPPPVPAAPVESAPVTSYDAAAPQACAADYSALPPVPVSSPTSYAAPAQDPYTSPSQTLPAVPSPYSPPAASDSYPPPGASSYLATGVDPAPFAYAPSDYAAAPEPVPPPSACQATYNQEPAPEYASVPAVDPYAAPLPVQAPLDYAASAPVPVTYESAPLPCSASETAPAPAPAPSAYQDSYQQSPSAYAPPVPESPAPSPTPYSAPAPAPAYEAPSQYVVETPSSCSSSSQYPTPSVDPVVDTYAAPSQPAISASYPAVNPYPVAAEPAAYSAPAPTPCSAPDQYSAPAQYVPSDKNSVSSPDPYPYQSPSQYQAPATDLTVYSTPTSAPSENPYAAQYPLPAPVAPASDPVNYSPISAYAPAPAPACACSSNPPQSGIASLKYDIPAIIGAPQEISGQYAPDLAAFIAKWIDNNPLATKNGLQSIAPFYYQPTYTLIEYKSPKRPESY